MIDATELTPQERERLLREIEGLIGDINGGDNRV